jgi:hypothetical protein
MTRQRTLDDPRQGPSDETPLEGFRSPSSLALGTSCAGACTVSESRQLRPLERGRIELTLYQGFRTASNVNWSSSITLYKIPKKRLYLEETRGLVRA